MSDVKVTPEVIAAVLAVLHAEDPEAAIIEANNNNNQEEEDMGIIVKTYNKATLVAELSRRAVNTAGRKASGLSRKEFASTKGHTKGKGGVLGAMDQGQIGAMLGGSEVIYLAKSGNVYSCTMSEKAAPKAKKAQVSTPKAPKATKAKKAPKGKKVSKANMLAAWISEQGDTFTAKEADEALGFKAGQYLADWSNEAYCPSSREGVVVKVAKGVYEAA